MKLKKLVNIDNWFSRSINLERDNASKDAITSYVPTSTTLKTLKAISGGFVEKKYNRAWTLIGPYGSGKSSFAIYLNALTQNSDSTLFKEASLKLKELDANLASRFREISAKGGAISIMLTGSFASLEDKLFHAIFDRIMQLNLSKKSLASLKEFKSSLSKIEPNNVIELVTRSQSAIEESNLKFGGLIIVIDELGKFVEYAGKNQSDIYLLQSLAELSVVNSKTPLFFIGMLHQTLDYYAKELDIQTKNEWRKIQGRFEEITFIESIEQTIRIIARAMLPSFSQSQDNQVKRDLKSSAQGIVDNKIFANLSKIRETVNFFHAVYPLHPVTAILLPILAQKLGQNERTVFTYLGSAEQFGFQDQIANIDFPSMIMPSALFDYFVTNQASYIYDHFTHKRWLEVLDAIERLGDSDELTLNLLKTIGLLNIVGSNSNLRSSKEFLQSIFPESDIANSLKALETKSIITFRSFNNEYRVWQGSDFDFDAALSHELAQLDSFELSKEINELMSPVPLVAKKYSVESGSLRIIPSMYLTEKEFLESSNEQISHSPRVIYMLKDNQKLSPKTLKLINNLPEHIITLDINSDLSIERQVKELKALRVIFTTYDSIQSDPIARRELSDQIDHRQTSVAKTLKKISDPSYSTWYWRGSKLKLNSQIAAQAQLSKILESLYPKCPVIKNELINRDFISSQGQSARTKLMKDMLNNRSIPNLGYATDKYPPEKTIFNAIFIANNLYEFKEGKGAFLNPSNKSALFEVYSHLTKLLLSSKEPVSFATIQTTLASAPFGIKAGLHHILFMGFYLANEENLAVYEEGIFRPYINNESIDRLVRKTETFAFQMHAFQGQQAIISQYSESLFDSGSKDTNILNIVKQLSKVMKGLPEYVHNTRSNLSNEAIKFRSSFQLSKSPQDLLLKDIPVALGYKPEQLSDKKVIENFSKDLNRILSELNKCYEELLLDQRTKFNMAFDLDPNYKLHQLRTALRTKYLSLRDYSVDSLSLKPFLSKVLEEDAEDQFWLEGLLSFLVKRHPHKWFDENISEAEVELRNISDRMKDIAKLQVYESQKGFEHSKDIDVFVMRLKKRGQEEKDVITTLSAQEKKRYLEFKKNILAVLDEFSSDKEERLTYLAPLMDEILQDKMDNKAKLKVINKDKK